MNGALYISFFQGQLESALEQVVQLAVQEITKTAGATLNSMLLETATKEQENQRLRATIQSRELEHGGKRKSNASKRRKDTNDGTKQHTPSQSTECRVQSETFRREQKGRAVGQLKAVMEHVLEFAVCELTKIVEDNFDDLLVEFTKKERENQILKEQLQDKNIVEDSEVADAETEDCENDSDSPSSSKMKRQESQGMPDQSPKKAWEKEQTETTNEADKQTVIAVAQDWVPILDKVFGQKWCSDLFQIKEVTTSKEECSGLGSGSMSDMDSLIRETLMPSCLASQRKLELEMGQLPWLQAKDMEVVSLSSDTKGIPVVSSTGDDSNIRSPSMLQRLLTLPYQLLEDDEESMDAVPSLEVCLDPSDSQVSKGSKSDQISANKKKEQENLKEEEEDEEDETRTHELDRRESLKHKSRRKSHACKKCDRMFSRVHLLRAHQQTHEETPNRCQECGKIFSQSSKLQAHLRTHTGKTI
ncbi:zinc finger protein 396-like [Myxocyprinus asiaticus]|uniref:zinc finger protein 396-like n=1 Tax=Myxocyprinus asiaticus TaxID=70543 RepID=UPI002223ED45|nr:zinc finger protein 396-like [Myxocyprinus asiaticus]